MSRYYSMVLNVSGHNPEKAEEIMEVAKEHWSFDDDDFDDSGNNLFAAGEDSLCGGKSEEEFTTELSEAIWKVNGAFCTVQVDATYLEDLPCETHMPDEDDYKRFLEKDKEED